MRYRAARAALVAPLVVLSAPRAHYFRVPPATTATTATTTPLAHARALAHAATNTTPRSPIERPRSPALGAFCAAASSTCGDPVTTKATTPTTAAAAAASAALAPGSMDSGPVERSAVPVPATPTLRATASTPQANRRASTAAASYGELRLATGAVAIPHPDKVAKGGEDAYFVSSVALGVFDGVGGWASIGVDPGLYSKQLASTTAKIIRQRGPECALESLVAAVDDNSAIGSSTACVVGLVQEPASSVTDSPQAPDDAADQRAGVSPAVDVPLRSASALVSSAVNDGKSEPLSSSVSSASSASLSSGPPGFPSDVLSASSSASDSSDDVSTDSSTGLGSSPSDAFSLDDVLPNSRTSQASHRNTHPQARLQGVNLGDSGLIVIRNGVIVYATKEQQHYFNCPFQVGSGVGSDSVDTPLMGDTVDFVVYPGDCIILATDGLWDNAFPHEILATVAAHSSPFEADLAQLQLSPSASISSTSSSSSSPSSPKPVAVSSPEALKPMTLSSRHPDPSVVAKALAEFALQVAMDDRRQSPFAVNAQDAGHIFRGGKLDDITIVAAYVKAADPVCSGEALPPFSPITPARSPSSTRQTTTTASGHQPVAMETDDAHNMR